MKSVVVTGGCGFVGRRIASALSFHPITRDNQLVITTRDRPEIPPNPLLVVHCAAQKDVAACERSPESSHRDNVGSSSAVLAAGPRFAVFLSSDMVYDGESAPYDDARPDAVADTCITNEYGRQKRECERLFLTSGATACAVLRVSVVWGDSTIDGRECFAHSLFRMMRGSSPPILFSDQVRSPVFVNDVVLVVLRLATRIVEEGSMPTGIFNLGGPAPSLSRWEMGQAMIEAFPAADLAAKIGLASEVDLGGKRPRDTTMISARIKQELQVVTTPFRWNIARINLDAPNRTHPQKS